MDRVPCTDSFRDWVGGKFGKSYLLIYMFSVSRKRRGRSGVEEWLTHQAHDLKIAGSNPAPA